VKVAVYSAKRYDRELLAAANAEAGHELHFFDDLLEPSTVVVAADCGAVCVFVNDVLDGLLGADLHGCTVGVIGTGKMGRVFARVMSGFGCELIGYDKFASAEFERMGGR
jgi:lactate dehydrogenase-like 2-hydroxyacid dehydrogenase